MHPETGPDLKVPMVIGGQPFAATRAIEVRNPARPSEIAGRIGRATPEDVERAIAAARAAQRGWGAKSHADRIALLGTALERVDAMARDLAPTYVRENGKVLVEAERELAGLRPRQQLLLSTAAQLDNERAVDSEDGRTLVLARPFGVVVSIVPWNSPLSLGFAQVVAALVTGNSVVIKPPETCPLVLSLLIGELAKNLPDGVLNLVTGLPDEIGTTLTTHPDIAKIAFTGSVASARRIMCSAAEHIAGVTLELGGNDAAIVMADADLSDESLDRFARATFTMAGQVCMAIKRAYVHKSLVERFTERLAHRLDTCVTGDGTRPETTMGPMHTRAALERAQALIEEARTMGANVTAHGRLAEADIAAGGHYLRPTLVTDLPDEARLVSEEQFAPILPILTFDDPENAIERANATTFGLGGSVWSQDLEAAAAIAGRLEAGTVFVNRHGTGAVNRRAPYGGIKHSGIGRKSGLEGLMEFVELRTLTVSPA